MEATKPVNSDKLDNDVVQMNIENAMPKGDIMSPEMADEERRAVRKLDLTLIPL